MSNIKLIYYVIILTFLTHSATVRASDDSDDGRTGIKSSAKFVKLLTQIQSELNAVKSFEDKDKCRASVAKLVSQLDSFDAQYGFATISYSFLRACTGPTSNYAYEVALVTCLQLMAKDKSKDAADAFRRLRQQFDLDGGLGLQFDNAKRAQQDPNYK